MSDPATPPEGRRPASPALVRAVGLLDVFLGLWAVAIAAGYIYLRFENYRMTINGVRVNMFGAFHALVINAQWVAMVAGMDEVPGGTHNTIPGSPQVAAFGTFRVMTLFPILAAGYVAVAAACFALADGLSRGLRWARRAHEALGWAGLAVVAVYGILYLLSTYAPKLGLLAVAGAAAIPAAMIFAGRAPRGGEAAPSGRRLGMPSWALIAAGLAILALAIHVVGAWWSLLLIKACWF